MSNPNLVSIRIVERLSGTNFLIQFDSLKERMRSLDHLETKTLVKEILHKVLPAIDLNQDYQVRILDDDFNKVQILRGTSAIPKPQEGRRMDYMKHGDVSIYVYHYELVPAETSRLLNLIESLPEPTRLFQHILTHLPNEDEIVLSSKGYTIGRVRGISNP